MMPSEQLRIKSGLYKRMSAGVCCQGEHGRGEGNYDSSKAGKNACVT